jgi:glycosyltransferase involved in cell wall biosynthesis
MRRDKTLLTILDFVFVVNNRGLKKKLLLFFWGTIPARRVRFISVISEATKIQALEYLKCNPNMVRVVPVPISSVFIRYDKEFNTEKPTLLQVGTSENKNIIRLADALRGVSCKLEIIGKLSCDQLASLKRNNIEYVNSYGLSEEEVLAKYRQADLVTFVSTYEGFGMPIVEANAVGRPVITSNVYSMPEVAGNAACIVDPLNINDIKNGVLRIIGDKIYREKLVQDGFTNAKRFDASIIAEQYAKIYHEIYRRKK